eukprot:2996889-Prymnesium_polylepis.1
MPRRPGLEGRRWSFRRVTVHVRQGPHVTTSTAGASRRSRWMCPFQSRRCKGTQCRMVKGAHGVSKFRQHLVALHPHNPLARLMVMRYDALLDQPASTTIARLDELVETPRGFPLTRADLTLTQAF